MRSKFSWKDIIYILVFFVGYGRFLPLPYAPELLHDFFSGWDTILFLPAFLYLVINFFKRLRKNEHFDTQVLISLIVLIVFVGLFFCQSFIREIDNQIVIYVNQNRNIENFSNPVLGMKIQVNNSCDCNVTVNGVTPVDCVLCAKNVAYSSEELFRENHLFFYPDGIPEGQKYSNFYMKIYDDKWIYKRELPIMRSVF